MQSVIFQMPPLEEGKIVRWIKRKGDHVRKDEPLVEIETEEVNLEIIALEGGIIREVLVLEGEIVYEGMVLALIGQADEPLPPLDVATLRSPLAVGNVSEPVRLPFTRLQLGLSLLTLLLIVSNYLFSGERWLFSILLGIVVILNVVTLLVRLVTLLRRSSRSL